MNDRHPPEDSYPPVSAPHADYASYASYDTQGVQYGDGSYTGYDGYDAYATGSVATATATFTGDGGSAADPLTGGAYASGGFEASDATGAFATGSFTPGAFASVTDYESDPLFGDLPGNAPATGDGYDNGQWYDGTSAEAGAHNSQGYDAYGGGQHDYGTVGYDAGYETGRLAGTAGYDSSGQWDASAWAQLSQNPLDSHEPWGTGTYPAQTAARQFSAPDHTAPGYEQQNHETAGYEAAGYEGAGFETAGYDTQDRPLDGYDTQGQALDGYAAADAQAAHGYATGSFPVDGYEAQDLDPLGLDTPAYPPQHHEADPYGTQQFDATGAQQFEHTDLASPGAESTELLGDHSDLQAYAAPAAPASGTPEPDPAGHERERTDLDPPADFGDPAFAEDEARYDDEDGSGYDAPSAHEEAGLLDAAPQDEAAGRNRSAPPTRRSSSRSARPSGSRTRRRSPAKRSALLTVAVPSVCVMGVAGIAAASVGGVSSDDKQTTASSGDEQTVRPSEANNKLDTQLDNLSADTRDFADRASRTQERIDLEAKQEAERKRAAEEAARKERLRPKFALPVAQHGLSAYYGQSGINWMSVHTGIDFPVAYGTQVMAATDGTVRTQYNTAYGNMAIVTAKDGTETWYCHLSSYRVSSGTTVKAGDVIAFSGNSGNSTGPHLHFEVRPGGGSAIDPLPWLRSHGLDPN